MIVTGNFKNIHFKSIPETLTQQHWQRGTQAGPSLGRLERLLRNEISIGIAPMLEKFTQFFPVVCISCQWRLSLSPDGATEPWSIFGRNEKKHWNKNTLKAYTKCHNTKVQLTVNISSFKRLSINFRLLFSIIVWTLGIPYEVRVLTAIGFHYHWLQKF